MTKWDAVNKLSLQHKATVASLQSQYTQLVGSKKEILEASQKETEAQIALNWFTKDATEAYYANQILLENQMRKNILLGDDFFAGFKLGALDYRKSVEAMGETGKRIFGDIKKAIEDASDTLVDFVTTGKANFADMLATMARDLLKSQLRSLMTQLFFGSNTSGGAGSSGSLGGILGLVAGAFGGGGGGMGSLASGLLNKGGGGGGFTASEGLYSNMYSTGTTVLSPGGITGFATGGDIYGNKPVMVGERGPEIFVPNSAGTIIPNNSNSGGLTINVPVNVSGNNKMASELRSEIESTVLRVVKKHM
jgi:hypothetical protein